jgi:hypothetical protein
LIRKLREDQERSEKRAEKAKKNQDRRSATERGEVMMADEAGDIDKEGVIKRSVPVTAEKD